MQFSIGKTGLGAEDRVSASQLLHLVRPFSGIALQITKRYGPLLMGFFPNLGPNINLRVANK
jgi:hypothetical protein